MDELEWKNPPRPRTKSDLVAAKLRTKPHVWARIGHTGALAMMPWWRVFEEDPEFELQVVYTGETIFGPRDIYARYVGEGSGDPNPEP